MVLVPTAHAVIPSQVVLHYTDFVMSYLFQRLELKETVESSFIRLVDNEFLANSGIAAFKQTTKGGVECICLNKSQRRTMPWGISMPKCTNGCIDRNVLSTPRDPKRRPVKYGELLPYRFKCGQCKKQTAWSNPPPYITAASVSSRYTWTPFPQTPVEVRFDASAEDDVGS